MNRFAFTLVELVVVVLIIGILAVAAIPRIASTYEDAAINATMTDLRAMERALVRYKSDNGLWPADRVLGVFPTELEGYLRKSQFTKGPAVGGKFDWNHNWSGMTAAIAVFQNPVDNTVFARIDNLFDDGDLNTGGIQQKGKTLNIIIE